MWSLIANVMRGGEITYGEISLVGSHVSRLELLCHSSVARVGSRKHGGEGSRCAAPNFQKGTPQSTVNEFFP